MYQRGVAYITLAHFYPNRVVNPCYPFPEDFANLSTNPNIWRDLTLGLTDLGKRVVERMIELGIIDRSLALHARRAPTECLTSPRPAARQVPLLATHVGAYDYNPTPYNLRDWEVKRIARDGGVVGVIFMPYWLIPHGHGQGLNDVARTIEYFVNVAGEDAVGPWHRLRRFHHAAGRFEGRFGNAAPDAASAGRRLRERHHLQDSGRQCTARAARRLGKEELINAKHSERNVVESKNAPSTAPLAFPAACGGGGALGVAAPLRLREMNLRRQRTCPFIHSPENRRPPTC